MIEPSGLAPSLVQAYRSAIYRVLDSPPFDLRIGEYSARLATWHIAAGVEESAIVTAVNPESQQLSIDENRLRTRRLKMQLQDKLPSDAILDTLGIDPAGQWPEEPGFLIAGMKGRAVDELMVEFGQNAWVRIREDAVPRLEWTGRS